MIIAWINAHVVLAEIGNHRELVAYTADAEVVTDDLGDGKVVEDQRDAPEVINVLHDAKVRAARRRLMLEHLQSDGGYPQRPNWLSRAQQSLGLLEVEARPERMTCLVKQTPSPDCAGVS